MWFSKIGFRCPNTSMGFEGKIKSLSSTSTEKNGFSLYFKANLMTFERFPENKHSSDVIPMDSFSILL